MGQAVCGLRVRSATLAPCRRAPLTPAAQPGRFSLSFCFVSFRFLSVRILCQEDSALSPPDAPAAGLRPLPAAADLSELRSCPRPPRPCPLLPHAPVTAPGNDPREPQGPKLAQVRTPGLARPERRTSGCRAGRSRPRRRRGTPELSRGPGEGFLVQATGRGVRPDCPRLGTAR